MAAIIPAQAVVKRGFHPDCVFVRRQNEKGRNSTLLPFQRKDTPRIVSSDHIGSAARGISLPRQISLDRRATES